ncbi:MAG: GNAT family N-acetyltransferase [Candidatus Levyibacteriota bacterium]
MKATIRKAVLSDFNEILRLNKALFDFEARFNQKYNLDWTYSEVGRGYFKKRFESEHSLIYVAEIEGKTIGYIMAFIDTYPYRSVNPICEIDNMFVEEAYRGKGSGGDLVKAVKTRAQEKGAKIIRVGAIAQNDKTLNFYRIQGFNVTNVYLETEL